MIRPGRIDRSIEIPVPSKESLLKIFQVHTRRMNLAEDVNADLLFDDHDDISGADVMAICTDAGNQYI